MTINRHLALLLSTACLLGSQVQAAGYVSLTQADGVTPVSPTSPLNVTGTFTPSGTGAVNLTQINGVAPSVTNPLFTAFAEAGDTTGTFTNATQTTSVTASNGDGYGTALVSINGTYGTATGVFEESDDNGTTWYTVVGTRSDNSAPGETGYATLSNVSRQWVIALSGNDSIRVRSTAVASGTVNVRISIVAAPNATTVNGTVNAVSPTGTSANQVQGTAASGTAVTGNPVLIGGSDGTNVKSLNINASGQLNVTMGVITGNNNTNDGVSASSVGLNTLGFGYGFNGASFDRSRTITGAALVATGIGDAAVADAPHNVAVFAPVSTAGSTLTVVGAKNRYVATLSNSDSVTHYLWIINTSTTPTNATLTLGTASGNVVECGTAVAGGSVTLGGSVWPFPYSAAIYLADSTTTCNAASPTLTLTSTAASMTLLAK